MSRTAAVVSGIAALASLVGAAAAWLGEVYPQSKELFARFDPSITLSQPTLSSSPQGELTIVYSLKFANDSSISGCVKDVSLKLEANTKRWKATYFPVFVIDMSKYTEFLELGDATPQDREKAYFKSVKQPFGVVRLAPESSVEQTLLFLHRPPTEVEQDAIRITFLEADQYIVKLAILKAEKNCALEDDEYSPVTQMRFILHGDDVNLLKEKGHVTPLEMDLDAKRRQEVSRN